MAKYLDLRLCAFVLPVASGFAFLLKGETAIAAAVIFALLWICFYREWRSAITAGIGYLLLVLLGYILSGNTALSSLSVMLVILRRAMLPALFALPLMKASSGILLASLEKLRLPRPLVISLAVLFRFFPTIHGEYLAIRTSLKFRGIGVGISDIIRHPLRFLEAVMVPLLIRITRLSDELSASALLRGADSEQNRTSYYIVKMKSHDFAVLAFALLLSAGFFVFDGLEVTL